MNSGKNRCIGASVVVFRQSGCKRAKCLYSGKVVVFGQKWLYSGKSGFIRAKFILIGQSFCIRAKVVVFGQSVCILKKIVVSLAKGL